MFVNGPVVRQHQPAGDESGAAVERAALLGLGREATRDPTSFEAATTFDVARRATAPRDASRWMHPAPATFPHQGFVCANGLTVAAPGLRVVDDRLDVVVPAHALRSFRLSAEPYGAE